jgi:phage terminase large subunit-like protein
MTCLTASGAARLLNDWQFWGRRDQLAPRGDWRTWVFMGGRGAGKTRAGAEWVDAEARYRRARRIALIAPTFHDVREVMVAGPSGLRSLPGERPAYEASRRRLVWPNGAQAYCFSAEDPEALRGPQFDAAWCDELCFWAHAEETLGTLEHGLRLGDRPRLMVTTTPRPIAALKRLLAARDTVQTNAISWHNAANLSPHFMAALNERWLGSAYQRQELFGDLIEDLEGALWRRAELEALRSDEDQVFERIVVAVDPPASANGTCGIVAAGASGSGASRRVTVLADASVKGAQPQVWAARATELARSLGAHAIVAEANNGGDMVRAVLRAAAPDAFVRLVHASSGKRLRAAPIATHYAQGRVRHRASFGALEDEMCTFGAEGFTGSPDRLDALVWALTDLFAGGGGPSVRML